MTARAHAVAAAKVFDGVDLHDDATVLIRDDRIEAVVARGEVPANVPLHDLPQGAWLAPGFIDIQVNGGGDVLFNATPTPEGIRSIVAAHRGFGTTSLLPTLISDSPEKMAAAIAAVETVLPVEPGVLGIHLEGPFLSAEKAGVHTLSAIRKPTSVDLDWLTRRRSGVMLLTLAPECVPLDMISKLVEAGVRVALGHSMATYEQTTAAMTRGLTGFTHLFNAMRPLDAREGGPIAAALESRDAWYGLIVDGIHVAPAMLKFALRGAGHPILVTDAMPPVGGKLPRFVLDGEAIEVRDGCCRRSDGRLAGAFLDMASAVRNCVKLLQVPLTAALRFASVHPAAFLGVADRLGRIAPGYRADMVALDGSSIEVLETWVAGRRGDEA